MNVIMNLNTTSLEHYFNRFFILISNTQSALWKAGSNIKNEINREDEVAMTLSPQFNQTHPPTYRQASRHT